MSVSQTLWKRRFDSRNCSSNLVTSGMGMRAQWLARFGGNPNQDRVPDEVPGYDIISRVPVLCSAVQ